MSSLTRKSRAGTRIKTTLPHVPGSLGSMWKARVSLQIGAGLAAGLLLLGVLHVLLPSLLGNSRFASRGWNDSQVWATLYGYLLFFGVVPSGLGLVLGILSLDRGELGSGNRDGQGEVFLAIFLNASFLVPSLGLYLLLARLGYFGFVLGLLPYFLEVPVPAWGANP